MKDQMESRENAAERPNFVKINRGYYNGLIQVEKQLKEYKALYLSEFEARSKLVDIHANLMMETDSEIVILKREVEKLKDVLRTQLVT